MVRYGRRFAMAAALIMVLAACGGSGGTTTTGPSASSTKPPTATSTVATTTTVAGPAAAGTLQDVRGAVVRIVAEGSFVDPEQGQFTNATGSGSGFILDPSGLAMTNNHVVTGAALLRVYVEGEDQPRNAKILGVSECSDLALIDISGDGYPFLDWYGGDVTAGLKVFAAGFPLGDPEYTLTEGIVSKERGDGESSWSSVDHVIEHTAKLLPGNSGGPLVTEDGKVVGINYAGIKDLGIQFAITKDEALSIIDDLKVGDVTSIGVNGSAIATTDPQGADLTGVWVSGVASGSPVAKVGIKPGDIITKLEGLALATDGTMADYCDILRTHDPSGPLAVEVYRSSTGEVLTGTLNADEQLTLAFSFADQLSNDVASGASYDAYDTITDDSGTLTVQVPTAWTDRNGANWNYDGAIVGVSVAAAPSLDGFYNSWSTPGMFFAASSDLVSQLSSIGDLLDAHQFPECTYDGRSQYSDQVYHGVYDVWLDCGGTSTAFVVLEAYPDDESFVVLVQVQIVSDADLEALDKLLGSFDLRQ